MAAMNYVAKKGYIKEYEVAEREAGLTVFACKVAEDLWMAADESLAGTLSPELVAFQEAKINVNGKNLTRVEVAGKMLLLYENLLCKNARHK